MSVRARALVVFGVVACLLLGSVVPTVAEPPGAAVGKDRDVTVTGLTLAATGLCAIDADGGGDYDVGEVVVLDTDAACTTPTERNDVRLSGPAAGTFIRTSDPDFAVAVVVVNDDVKFHDADGNAVFSSGDTLYADIVTASVNRVDPGDLRLTAYGTLAGLTVAVSGQSDINLGLAELPSVQSGDGNLDIGDANAVVVFDASGDGALGPTDGVYLNLDALSSASDPGIELNDVRLTPFGPGLPAGTAVGKGDGDLTVVLVGLAAVGLCAVDGNGNATYDPGEALVVDTDGSCTTNSEENELRLTPSGGRPPGTLIQFFDPDFNQPMVLVNDDLRYYDANGNNLFDAGDTAYADIIAPLAGRVDAGDLRLTPHGSAPGASVVGPTGSDVNLALQEFPGFQGGPRDVADLGSLAFFDGVANGALGAGDTMYLRLDRQGTTEVSDLRLMAFSGSDAFAPLNATSDDLVHTLRSFSAHAACAIDENADGDYDAGEPVFVDVDAICATNTEINDVRLTPSGGRPGGTLVSAADADFNRPVVGLPSDALKYYDANGDNAFQGGDTLYLDIMAGGFNRVDVGDVRLTAYGSSPGLSVVVAGASDINLGLGQAGFVPEANEVDDTNALAYFEAGGDDDFNAFDVLYWNKDGIAPFPDAALADELVRPQDVRLTELGSAFSGGPPPVGDVPPIARAVSPTVAECVGGEGLLLLDGSASFDPNHKPLTYAWSGPGFIFEPSAAATIAKAPLGRHLYTLTVDDGVFTATTVVEGKIVDTQPPSTDLAIEGSPGNAGWWRSALNVALTPHDTCGAASLFYAVSGGGPWPPNVTLPNQTLPRFQLSGDGNRHLHFYANDIAGNYEYARTEWIGIDGTPPTLGLAFSGTPGHAGWWRSAVTVTLAAYDATSGVHSTFVAVDSGPWQPLSSVTVAGDGTHLVQAYAVDVAGNVGPIQSQFILLDTTSPSVSMARPREGSLSVGDIVLPAATTRTIVIGDTHVLGMAQDALSGVARLELRVDGVPIDGVSFPLNQTPQALHNFTWRASRWALGNHTVEVWAFDTAGNEAAIGRAITTVPTAPEGLLATLEHCEGVVDTVVCPLPMPSGIGLLSEDAASGGANDVLLAPLRP